MNTFQKLAGLVLLACAFSTYAQVDTLYDSDINAGDTVTLESETTYFLGEKVFVEDSAVLFIEPGTVIKGLPGEAEAATALIICRGAKIYAMGTAEEPIIFTAATDDVSDPEDMEVTDRGLWGGIIILGKAKLNFTEGGGGENDVEGLPNTTTDNRGLYGGDDDTDNSGIFRFVSIRHGGSAISSDNEINGLTFGAVGSGTIVENVEVVCNLDDGFEWFGGTVNTKNLISAFCGDDAFDYDEGFRGKGQFWFALQAEDEGNRAGEHDGGPSSCETCQPYAKPVIYNATYIGSGSSNALSYGMILRDNAGVVYANSIFTSFAGNAIALEKRDDKHDSEDMLHEGHIKFYNNIFHSFGAGTAMSDIVKYASGSDKQETFVAASDFVDSLTTWSNSIADPQLGGIGRDMGESLDPIPASSGPAFSSLASYDDSWFTPVTYKGAFGSYNWANGWTYLSETGILTSTVGTMPNLGNDTISDNDITAGGNLVLSAEKTYFLKDKVFAEYGSVLGIDPGTVIKGLPGEAEAATALIIARGARMYAAGTADKPITFTAATDDVTDSEDMEVTDRGLWGGLIILGRAKLNFTEGGGGENDVEGLPNTTTDNRGLYGGNNDEDNSGLIKYVSIRHGGSAISSDNEINGMTFGAVGSGTKVHHIEVVSNLDDGFEWFGGTVNTKNLIAAFCGDDAFDYDEGFRGKGQFWFAIQAEDEGNRAGEHDGGPSSCETCQPYAKPVIYNATYIGSGSSNALSYGMILRDNAGVVYGNSIFTSFAGNAVALEKRDDKHDSEDMLHEGHIKFYNNIFHDFGAGTAMSDIVKYASGSDKEETFVAASDLVDSMTTWSNTIADPQLSAIGRDMGEELNPLPATGGPAYSSLAPYSDSWFTEVTYKGAFGAENWAAGWTYLSEAEILKATPIARSIAAHAMRNESLGITRNSSSVAVSFAIPTAKNVSLSLYNIFGRKIATLANGYHEAGAYSVTLDRGALAKGFYVCRLETAEGNLTKMISVVK